MNHNNSDPRTPKSLTSGADWRLIKCVLELHEFGQFDLSAPDWGSIPEHLQPMIATPESQKAVLSQIHKMLNASEKSESLWQNGAPNLADNDFFSQPASPGDKLGPWQIENLIGRGGSGFVYSAKRADGHYDARVACKVFDYSASDPNSIRRFNQEVQTLARLEHPNIARLYDAGISDQNRPYCVMELIDGQRISEVVKPLGLNDRLRLFKQLLDAVAFAHGQLVIHRDIKPSNVLVNRQGQVKLLDFGIAAFLEAGNATQVSPSQVSPTAAGNTYPNNAEEVSTGWQQTRISGMTPAFASPEQLLGQPVSVRSDIYSLGLLLRELLRSIDEPSLPVASAAQAIERLNNSRPSRNEFVHSSLFFDADSRSKGDDLFAIYNQATAKQQTLRYISAQAMADDIEAVLTNYPVKAQPNLTTYRLKKFYYRNRIGTLAGCLAMLAIFASAFVAVLQAQRATLARNVAVNQLLDIKSLTRDVILRYGDVGDYIPGGMAARVSMLEDLAGKIEPIVARNPQDWELKSDLATTYARLAPLFTVDNTLARLDNPQKGRDYTEKALNLFELIDQQSTNDKHLNSKFIIVRAMAYNAAGLNLRNQSKAREAILRFEQAATSIERVPTQFKSETLVLAELANSYLLQARALDNNSPDSLNQRDRAVDLYASAANTYQTALSTAKSDESLLIKTQLATTAGGQATVHLKYGELERAIDRLKFSTRLLSEVHKESTDVRYRSVAIAEFQNLAIASLRLNQPKDALIAAQRMWQLIDDLIKDEPANNGYRAARTTVSVTYGRALTANRQYEQALNILAPAREALDLRFRTDQSLATRKRLAWTEIALAQALLALPKQQTTRFYPAQISFNEFIAALTASARDHLLAVNKANPGDRETSLLLETVQQLKNHGV